MPRSARTESAADAGGGTSRALLRQVASLYYEADLTQAEIAARLGLSRPSVSRLLAEARRLGVVRIEIAPLAEGGAEELAHELRAALGLQRAFVCEATPPEVRGGVLAEALTTALRDVGLRRGSVLMLSTGRTIFETIASRVPPLPGVTIVPGVGGQGEPEPWYEANELTRRFASKSGGHPAFLYAPALPGPGLYETLLQDTATAAVMDLWSQARVAVLGIGPPPRTRSSIAIDIPMSSPSLRESVGDVCLQFFDIHGEPVPFPGSERIIATPLKTLQNIPHALALAVGTEKVPSILGAARGGFVNELITDVPTAQELIHAVQRESPDQGAMTP